MSVVVSSVNLFFVLLVVCLIVLMMVGLMKLLSNLYVFMSLSLLVSVLFVSCDVGNVNMIDWMMKNIDVVMYMQSSFVNGDVCVVLIILVVMIISFVYSMWCE